MDHLQPDPWRRESLGPTLGIYVSPAHGFGVDAFLLSQFATPKRRDSVCDLGTGCGIVALLWYRRLTEAPRSCWCVDIQPQAIAQLEFSLAEQPTLADRVHPLCADLRSLDSSLPIGQLDLVTCNPPYFPLGRGARCNETTIDQARHERTCTLEEVCGAAAALLRPGGRFCLCQRPERLADLLTDLRTAGLEPKRLRMVQQRPTTAPWLVLAEGRKGGAPGLQVETPFLLEQEDGTPTADACGLYR